MTTNASGGSIDSTTGAYVAGPAPDVTDVVRATDSLGNVASLSITVTTGVIVEPASVSVAPRGAVTFTASGGSGGGYAWQLRSNGSGAMISSSGAYTAGPTGGVTDVVRLEDALGNFALREVAVTANLAIDPATAVVARGARIAFVARGGSGQYTWSLALHSNGSITPSPVSTPLAAMAR